MSYNRQGELVARKDQLGTVHLYEYDGLGRQTQDRVTTLGNGVDATVRRIATTYEVRGMVSTITSYNDAGTPEARTYTTKVVGHFCELCLDLGEGLDLATLTPPAIFPGKSCR